MKKIITLLFLITILSVFQSCSPSATCSDGIKNQNETGVDCGGPCTNCATCMDGIQNQSETAVDCGGTCIPCVTCSDGIQNQNETGIDCGGPCGNCAIIYPATGLYGQNYLRTDTITLKGVAGPNAQPSYMYSMRAQLPDNASLKIKMICQSFDAWYYTFGSQVGWAIGNYQTQGQYQEFNASGKVNCDVQITFKGSGSALLEFYEYGATTPTRTKTISW